MLINYIRTPRKQEAKIVRKDGITSTVIVEKGYNPYGVIVATNRNQVGWAMCSPKDFYNKNLGLEIALNRAEYYGTNKEKLLEEAPYSIKEELLKMYDRSEHYYK